MNLNDLKAILEKNGASEEVLEAVQKLIDAQGPDAAQDIDLSSFIATLPPSVAAELQAVIEPAAGDAVDLHGRFQDAMYMQMPHVDLKSGEPMGDEMSTQSGGELSIEGALNLAELEALPDEEIQGDLDPDAPMMAMMMKFAKVAGSFDDDITHSFNLEVRSITGEGNNVLHPEYGTSASTFITISGYQYGDGFSTPNDADRPSARAISNEIFAQNGNVFNTKEISNFLWVWGQFLDHDINLTRESKTEDYSIKVPTGDIYFDPANTGTKTITLTRSAYADGTGTDADNPRLQVNKITAFIDASNVYGSTAEVQASLRDEGGKLLLSEGDLLPVGTGDRGVEFKAGDERANENAGLTSIHTMFAREHNFWVDKIAAENPTYTDEQLYQAAKAIVEAEIQHVTYNEFLPLLLGQNALSEYKGYNPDINPQITTEFATAAFRVGHTMLSSDIYRMQESGDESEFGHMTLQNAFFRPDLIMSQGGIDEIVRGLGASYSQGIDAQIIDDVRNFLFGPPGSGGFDLVSLNIQRGRDHGIADFNSVREAYGLDPIASFEDLTQDAVLSEKLTALYGDISHLDLWVGGLLEDAYQDALVGETFYTIILDQFTRLRDGDRFWYEARFDEDVLDVIRDTSLSDIIMRNTNIEHLQDDIFSALHRVMGGEGNNVIEGSEHGDLLIGLGGNDVLHGGAGKDTMYGGDGHDVYVFDTTAGGIDMIRDFDVNEDQIDISALLTAYDPLSDAIGDFVITTQSSEGLVIRVDQDGQGSNFAPQDVVLLEGVNTTNPLDLLITQQSLV